jgi:hypothetical protein
LLFSLFYIKSIDAVMIFALAVWQPTITTERG